MFSCRIFPSLWGKRLEPEPERERERELQLQLRVSTSESGVKKSWWWDFICARDTLRKRKSESYRVRLCEWERWRERMCQIENERVRVCGCVCVRESERRVRESLIIKNRYEVTLQIQIIRGKWGETEARRRRGVEGNRINHSTEN